MSNATGRTYFFSSMFSGASGQCVAGRTSDLPANVAHLLALCRTEGLEVIRVCSRFRPDKSDWMLMYRLHRVPPVSHHPCMAGQDGEEPVSFAASELEEMVVFKQAFDALHTPNLVPYLRENDKRVILNGMQHEVSTLVGTRFPWKHSWQTL